MVDIVGKPFYENYDNKNEHPLGVDHALFIDKAILDIQNILKMNFINTKDKLKLAHEIAEQALTAPKGSIEISIFLSVHNNSQM